MGIFCQQTVSALLHSHDILCFYMPIRLTTSSLLAQVGAQMGKMPSCLQLGMREMGTFGREYQPNVLQRKRKHGFLHRLSTKYGFPVLSRSHDWEERLPLAGIPHEVPVPLWRSVAECRLFVRAGLEYLNPYGGHVAHILGPEDGQRIGEVVAEIVRNSDAADLSVQPRETNLLPLSHFRTHQERTKSSEPKACQGPQAPFPLGYARGGRSRLVCATREAPGMVWACTTRVRTIELHRFESDYRALL